jgi:hypothetical protein
MTSNDSLLENFLRDFLTLLKGRAIAAKHTWKAAKAKGDTLADHFEGGRALAYYEVVSTFINEANTFGLSKVDIPELDFDPDKELLS